MIKLSSIAKPLQLLLTGLKNAQAINKASSRRRAAIAKSGAAAKKAEAKGLLNDLANQIVSALDQAEGLQIEIVGMSTREGYFGGYSSELTLVNDKNDNFIHVTVRHEDDGNVVYHIRNGSMNTDYSEGQLFIMLSNIQEIIDRWPRYERSPQRCLASEYGLRI